MASLITCLLLLCITTRVCCLEWTFPDDFTFGVATSAYQVEGGWNADGKSANIWDAATHNISNLIKNGDTGDIACDSYHKWEEDVSLIKNLGVDLYRFSLSWTRILPDGTTLRVNQPGVDYYNKLINKLLENNIEPVVTIYHWDLPEKFSALGGWTNPVVIRHYANYARKVFELFGDRVKTWITINEPRLICQEFKGLVGEITPDFPFGIAEYMCAHNVIKAHAEAYHIYDKEFRFKQNGRISITLDITWTEPEDPNNPADVLASEQRLQFDNGIYTHPILSFDYPKILKKRVRERSRLEQFPESRLPKFTLAEKLKIRGTYDFIGVNHYITYIGKAANEAKITTPDIKLDAGGQRYQDPGWGTSGHSYFRLTPWALRRVLNYFKDRYGNPEILITENGYPDAQEVFDDDKRINYHKLYLNATLQAIHEDGVNVKSYMAWSLMDNFEWTNGYSLRFGLYHVNFTDPNRPRTPKKSVQFFKDVTRTRTIP